MSDEVAKFNAADKVEEFVFFKLYTEFPVILAQLRMSRVYLSSKSKYKQDIKLEERAYVATMQGIVARAIRDKATLAAFLEDLPQVVHAMARKAWTASTTA